MLQKMQHFKYMVVLEKKKKCLTSSMPILDDNCMKKKIIDNQR